MVFRFRDQDAGGLLVTHYYKRVNLLSLPLFAVGLLVFLSVAFGNHGGILDGVQIPTPMAFAFLWTLFWAYRGFTKVFWVLELEVSRESLKQSETVFGVLAPKWRSRDVDLKKVKLDSAKSGPRISFGNRFELPMFEMTNISIDLEFGEPIWFSSENIECCEVSDAEEACKRINQAISDCREKRPLASLTNVTSQV